MRSGALLASLLSLAALAAGCGRFGFSPGRDPSDGGFDGDDTAPPPKSAGAITAGESFACAIRSGAVWCWGDDHDGELGDNATTPQPRPVKVMEISDATAV